MDMQFLLDTYQPMIWVGLLLGLHDLGSLQHDAEDCFSCSWLMAGPYATYIWWYITGDLM